MGPLVFLLLFGASALAVEPNCNEVLSGLSAELQISIHDLAKLRFDLDQRLARGESDILLRMLQMEYERKELEILSAAKIDRTALVAELKTEIKSLQNNAEIEEAHRVQSKSVERKQVADLEMKVDGIGDLLFARKLHSQGLLSDGRVVIAGGVGASSDYLDSVEIFDPNTKSSIEITNMKEPRAGLESVVLSDDLILAVGGSNGTRQLKSIELINLKTRESTLIGELKELGWDKALLLLPNGQVMVAGGGTAVELIDPMTGEVKVIGHLREEREDHTQSLLPDGRVIIVGGSSSMNHVGSIEIFNPRTGESEVIGQLNEARTLHTQSVLPDGQILVAGGYAGQGFAASIEVIDPKTGNSRTIGKLDEPRYSHTQTTLDDGRVLIVGGSNGERSIGSIVLIDPETGKSEDVLHLRTPRRAHRQTLLPDGRVLIVGGASGTGSKGLSSIAVIKVGRK